ncbi:MAG: hypothetical protein LBU11_12915 [Zoogloeaceae bacterium]|jgi:hypothetical protein|nr:hypothetical protein [Zoogloeaceae bacterium]
MSLAAAAIDQFPGVTLPNVLIAQFNGLYDPTENRRPFVAELAAEIFIVKLTPV